MDSLLRQFGDRFLDDLSKGQGFSAETDNIFSEWATAKMASIMDDDQRRVSSVNETTEYLRDLYNRCVSEAEEREFLYALSEATEVEDCSSTMFRQCAEKIVSLSEEEAIYVFESIEGSVGILTESAWKEEKSAKTVVSHNETGQKGVIVRRDNNTGDVVVVPLKGSTPLYRRQKMWRKGTFSTTDEKVSVDMSKASTKDSD